MTSKKLKRSLIPIFVFILVFSAIFSACSAGPAETQNEQVPITEENTTENTKPEQLPSQIEETKEETQNTQSETFEYTGDAFCVVNNNIPAFSEDEITTQAFEFFSELDEFGRCGMTMACIGRELMPTEDRESISHVEPSGWINVPYDFVDGEYLYNRCHLIGFQLTGENANERNLITGTRYMNVDGMLPFENMVADYVKETGNHVMYRVTPVFEGDELVARGVQMEALSVDDNGDGICFNVYVFNVQPGVAIDYTTGLSWAEETVTNTENNEITETESDYILNTNSKKFHRPDCSGAKSMKDKNKEEFTGYRSELIQKGYEPCGQCNP